MNSSNNTHTNSGDVAMVDDALAFFNDVFSYIPENYRHITKDMLEPAGNGNAP